MEQRQPPRRTTRHRLDLVADARRAVRDVLSRRSGSSLGASRFPSVCWRSRSSVRVTATYDERMTRSNGRRAALVVLALPASALVASCGGELGAQASGAHPVQDSAPPRKAPGTAHQLLVERDWLDRVGTSAIGEDYACASLSPRRRPYKFKQMKHVVFVTDAAAKPRVRQVAQKLSRPTRVRVIASRWRMSEMQEIQSEAEKTRPTTNTLSVERVPFFRHKGGCPPLEITYVKGEPAAEEEARWATALQDKYGKDRVRIRVLPPPRPEVAEWSLVHKPRPVDKQLSLLVYERACSSGKSAKGRISAKVKYRDDSVVATVRVRPLAGAQTCQANPPTPYELQLDEAVGERRVIDAADGRRVRVGH